MTVSGIGFLTHDPSPSAVIGIGMCGSTSWSSTTTVKCSTANVDTAQILPVQLTVAGAVGTKSSPFSFDAPLVSAVNRNAAVTGGGARLSVSGLGFGISAYTGTVALGFSSCHTTSWTTSTLMQCRVPSIWSAISTVQLTVVSLVGTGYVLGNGLFSFDAPVASFVLVNAAMGSQSLLTVIGLNLQYLDCTTTAQLVSAVCMTSAWTSATSVGCQASAPWDAEGSLYDVMRMVQVTVGGVVGTMTEAFSFDGPVASFARSNAVVSGRGSVTVSGLSFGLSEHTATASMSSVPCVTSAWQSSTSLQCLASDARSSGGQLMHTSEVTVSGFVGTGLELFSFDAAVASSVELNAPHSGDGSVTVSGLGFGLFEYTATAALGSAACSTSLWTSGTSVACQSREYYDYAGYVEVTVGALSGTGSGVFTYDPGRAGVFSFDAPVASGVQLNAPHSGDGSVTVSGLGFGSVTYTATAAVASAACSTSSWTSGTSVACQAVSMLGEISTVQMTVGGVVGTGYGGDGVFSFDGPVASFARSNYVLSGRGSVTVSGLSFGVSEATSSGGIGFGPCLTASWSSFSSVQCISSATYVAYPLLDISVGATVGTGLSLFTFDGMCRFKQHVCCCAGQEKV